MTPLFTFQQFATDPQLLGSVLGADSYLPMRAVIKAALAEPLSVAERGAFDAVAGGRAPPLARVAQCDVVAGRGAGKTQGAAGVLLYFASCIPWKVAPGQRPVALLLAADKAQAGIAFHYVRGSLRESELLLPLVESETADTITLNNGVMIRVGTSDHVSTRGWSYVCVVADEVAYWPTSLESASPDVEVLAALQPGLARMAGSMRWLISSPYAQSGALYEDFRRAFGQNDAHCLVVHGGTRAFNATFPQSEIDRALGEDPARFAAEYLGQWRTDIASFVDAQLVDSCTRAEPREYPRRHSTRDGATIVYSAGLDASGGRGDATALAIAHLDDANLVQVDCLRRWPAPHDPAAVAVQVAEVLALYGLTSASADDYGAEFARTVYSAAGVGLTDSLGNRSQAYLHLLPLLAQQRVELPPDTTLRVELLGLQRRTGRTTGRDVVDHRPGAHDDVANATALAVWAASLRRVAIAGSFAVIRSTVNAGLLSYDSASHALGAAADAFNANLRRL